MHTKSDKSHAVSYLDISFARTLLFAIIRTISSKKHDIFSPCLCDYIRLPVFVFQVNVLFMLLLAGYNLKCYHDKRLQYHQFARDCRAFHMNAVPILGLRPANEMQRYFVTTSLIGPAQA